MESSGIEGEVGKTLDGRVGGALAGLDRGRQGGLGLGGAAGAAERAAAGGVRGGRARTAGRGRPAATTRAAYAWTRAAREAVGVDSRLMVGAGGSHAYWQGDYKWALRTAELLAYYDVYWFEEPLHPDALDDYVALWRAASVTIAGGEVLTRRQSFAPW